MTDRNAIHGIRILLDDRRVPYDVLEWPADEWILAKQVTAYIPDAASSGPSVKCIICDEALGLNPVMLISLILPDQCCKGGWHFIAVVVARHVGCVPASDEALQDLIIEKELRNLIVDGR